MTTTSTSVSIAFLRLFH